MAEYSWREVKVTILGKVIEGIMEVSYEKEVEKKPIYGRGGKTKGIQSGNEKCTGDLTLRQSEVEAMLLAAKATNPLATPLDIIFDVQVQYNLVGDATIVKDRVLAAQFTKLPKGMKQGDMDMQIKMPFLAEDILYGVV
jgi:hypothetical protein